MFDSLPGWAAVAGATSLVIAALIERATEHEPCPVEQHTLDAVRLRAQDYEQGEYR